MKADSSNKQFDAVDFKGKNETLYCVLSVHTDDRQGICGCPGQVNYLVPFQKDDFKLIRPTRGLGNLPEGTCPNCRQYTERFLRVWKPELSSTVSQIIPATS